jgi:hypothetical protein
VLMVFAFATVGSMVGSPGKDADRSTVRYLGVEVDDALIISKQIEL